VVNTLNSLPGYSVSGNTVNGFKIVLINSG